MSYIKKEKIEEIKEKADIVSVVSDYVSLKKSGRYFMGNCPFHSEKTPYCAKEKLIASTATPPSVTGFSVRFTKTAVPDENTVLLTPSAIISWLTGYCSAATRENSESLEIMPAAFSF